MSTTYEFTSPVKKKDLIKAMNKLKFKIAKIISSDDFCITNEDSYIWCYCSGSDVDSFCRYGGNYNASDDILHPLAEELETGVISEHDDEYAEKYFNDEADEDE